MKQRLRIILILVAGAISISAVLWHLNVKESKLDSALDIERRDTDGLSGAGEYADLRGFRMTQRKIKRTDYRNNPGALPTCQFDTYTPWEKMKVPENFNPGEILELAKKPGLGIRELHKKGITGKGVKIAAIDMLPNAGHVEYKNNISNISLADGGKVPPDASTSMHGSGVASILVGQTCGIAPGASLYFFTGGSKRDYTVDIDGINQILEYNKDKDLAEKIRVVTITRGSNPKFKRLKEFEEALQKAYESGLTVVYVTRKLGGVKCSVYKNRDDAENYKLWNVFSDYKDSLPAGSIYVPCECITTAGRRDPNHYIYFGTAGLSWAVPYLAGVIALGYQVNPNLKTAEIFQYIRETGTPFNRGRLINPKAFIEKISSQ